MANNVYIGMRYVPIFMGAWDSTLSYEALCIVEYGNNTYTSKKPVPVGTLPTDSNYWVLTGNYNGAIAQLDAKINANSNRIKRPRAERKFIILGDSYAGGYTPDSADRRGWFYYFIQDNGLTENVNVFKSVATGTGNSKFSLADTQLSFVNHLRSIYETVLPAANVDPLDITDIIVLGGTNDMAYSGAAIDEGISDFFTYQKQHFPNAFVKVGVLAGFTSLSPTDQNNFQKVVLHYQQASKYGAAYITNSEFICANKALFSSDGIHPTVVGYWDISKYTSGLIDADSVDVFYSEYNTDVLDMSATFNDRALTANVRLHNERIDFYLVNNHGFVSFDFATPLTLAAANHVATFNLGTLKSNLLKAVGNGNSFGVNMVSALNAPGFIPQGLSTLYFDNGSVKIDSNIQIGDTNSRTYTQLLIQPVISVPTLQFGF